MNTAYSLNTQPQRYTATAIGLHWWIALLLSLVFALGIYMHDLPFSPTKLKLFSWHKWLGVTTFIFISIRVLWRLRHTPPPLPASITRWQQWASHTVHGLLYVLMVAIPLSGWLMSSAKGFQTVWFGILPLPDLLEKNKALGDFLALVHRGLNFSLLGLVALHVLAALKHHVVDKDTILRRMLPTRTGAKS